MSQAQISMQLLVLLELNQSLASYVRCYALCLARHSLQNRRYAISLEKLGVSHQGLVTSLEDLRVHIAIFTHPSVTLE